MNDKKHTFEDFLWFLYMVLLLQLALSINSKKSIPSDTYYYDNDSLIIRLADIDSLEPQIDWLTVDSVTTTTYKLK